MPENSGSSFPKVNFLGLLAAVIILFSIIFPWWGVTLAGFGTSITELWGLWGLSGDPIPGVVSSDFADVLTTFSPAILIIALASVALGVAGSFVGRYSPISASLVLAIGSLLGYAGLVSYAVSRNCQGASCISQPTGSSSFSVFSIDWGFQLGFYLFAIATVVLLLGLVLHRPLTQRAQAAKA
ncbi:MAG TPA: hypothetical protein VIH83_04750 [Candidatus Bathyarchaeia archaeon]